MPKDNISATDADQHRVGIEMMQAVYGDGPAGQLPAQLTNPFLVDTVALNDSLDDLRFRGVPRQRFERWCDQIGALWVKAIPQRWE